MMKKKICLLAFLFQILLLNAQINFQNDAVKTLLAKAKNKHKLIAFVVEDNDCNRCNDVAIKGLSVDSIKSILTKEFIVTKVQKIPAEINIDTNLLVISNSFFGLICTNENGDLLSLHPGSTSNSDHYFKTLNTAIKSKLDNRTTLDELKKNYYSNTKSIDALKILIEKIISLDIAPSQNLIDELTAVAPQDSAKSLTFLQYVLKLAPTVNSKAKNYVATNQEYFNTAWYRLDLPVRIEINNKVTIKSLEKAIATKNLVYAYEIAAFKRATYSGNNSETQKIFDGILLKYFKEVKDTSKYPNLALRYFETYCMNISVDSILQKDSLRNLSKISSTQTLKDSANPKKYILKKMNYPSQASFLSNVLNEGAWTVYTFTKDTFITRKALSWAKRAVEFEKTFATADTYARLLYKTNNMEEAIVWEKIAIDLAKKENENVDEFEEVLDKMEKKLSNIDKY